MSMNEKLVVLISDRAEWDAVKNILQPNGVLSTPFGEWFTASINHVSCPFMYGGWGKISSAASTQYAIQTWHPEVVVNLGTCGGFEGQVKKGQVLLVDRTIVYDIVEQMADPDAVLKHYTTELDLSWLRLPASIPVLRSHIVSGDRDLNPQDIPLLRQKFNAVAGDWESASIAWVCQHNETRCLILRGVSDIVSENGGEAYGNMEVYRQGTRLVMEKLIPIFSSLLSEI